MRPFTLTALISFLLLYPFQSAFAAEGGKEDDKPKLEMTASRATVDGRNATFSLTVLKPNAGRPDLQVMDLETKALMKPKAEAYPVNLVLLADTSKLCQIQRFDLYLAQLPALLKTQLHPDSRLTVATYTSASRDTLAQSMRLGDLREMRISCEPGVLSGSYEPALARLIDATAASKLPLKVWVLSSGNLTASDGLLKKLRDRNAEVAFFLYNPALEGEIQNVVERARQVLGTENARFTLLRRGEVVMPASYHKVAITLPSAIVGKQLSLKVSATQNGQEAGAALVTLDAPDNGPSSPLLTYLLILIALGAAAYLVVKLTRHYRPKKCPTCGKMVRFKDKSCLFCRKEGEAFLIGPANPADITRRERKDVIPLDATVIELGTHRKSRLPFIRPFRTRRTCYVKIIREQIGSSRAAYKVVRCAHPADAEIFLNGAPLLRNRYLASGDRLVIDAVPMVFYVSRRDSHDAA